MEIERAHLVEATAGREKGKLFYVMNAEGEYLFLADGKSRRVEAPKRKKVKHVRFIARPDDRVAVKIKGCEKVTNSELRKAIAAHSGGTDNSDQEG